MVLSCGEEGSSWKLCWGEGSRAGEDGEGLPSPLLSPRRRDLRLSGADMGLRSLAAAAGQTGRKPSQTGSRRKNAACMRFIARHANGRRDARLDP